MRPTLTRLTLTNQRTVLGHLTRDRPIRVQQTVGISGRKLKLNLNDNTVNIFNITTIIVADIIIIIFSVVVDFIIFVIIIVMVIVIIASPS